MIKIGTVFAGRYGIIDKIDSGGSADIYKAKDLKLSRLVALKVLKPELSKDKEFVDRFELEGQAAASIDNPNIVSIYDVGNADGTYYIAMELIDGITLKEYIRRKGVLTARETMAITAQVSVGLRAAHAHHIVHRDIKPQNIMLSRAGKVKISDFGIARAFTDHTKTSTDNAMGSVYYMAPEQAKGLLCDERSDMYSLGITMYEMITGRVPFDKETSIAVALAHMNETMVPPSSVNPECPVSLEQIIYRCTQKSRERRYHSCTELLKDLKIAVANPDFNFEKEDQNSVMRTNTQVFSEKDLRNVRKSTPYQDETEMNGRNRLTADTEENETDGPDYDDDRDEDYEGVRRPVERKRRPEETAEEKTLLDRFLLICGIVLAVFAAAMLIYIISSFSGCDRNTGRNDETENEMITLETLAEYDPDTDAIVPSLVGLPVQDAIKALRDAKLDYKISSSVVYSDEYPIGAICKQSYPKDTIVKQGSTIVIVLSAGTDKFTIKDSYVGGKLSDFKADFARFSDIIDVTYERVVSETIPANTIISVSPSSGILKAGDKITVKYSSGPSYVYMPNLIGSSKAQAQSTLLNSGLTLGECYDDYSDTVEKGKVCSQQYEQGTRLRNGTAVSVGISLGAKTVELPDLIGETKKSAEKKLKALGLLVEFVEEYDKDKKEGTVIGMDPVAGSSPNVGDTVTLTVSTKTKTKSDTIGDYTGKHIYDDNVKATLEEAGYIVKIEYEDVDLGADPSANTKKDRIALQTPSAGTKLEAGESVVLRIYRTYIKMPEIRGLTVQKAREILSASDIAVIGKGGIPLSDSAIILTQGTPVSGIAYCGTYVEIEIQNPEPESSSAEPSSEPASEPSGESASP